MVAVQGVGKTWCGLTLSDANRRTHSARVDELHLTPLDLIDRMAALVQPLPVHRHRYFGELASNPLLFPKYGAKMHPTEFRTYSADNQKTLDHIGADSEPPHVATARSKPKAEQHLGGRNRTGVFRSPLLERSRAKRSDHIAFMTIGISALAVSPAESTTVMETL